MKIEIDLLTLIGILCIIIGSILMVIFYYIYQEETCVQNPIIYANEHSKDYWFDYVEGFSWQFKQSPID